MDAVHDPYEINLDILCRELYCETDRAVPLPLWLGRPSVHGCAPLPAATYPATANFSPIAVK